MTGYLDSSVLLRALLNQPGALAEFSNLRTPVSSKLLKTECLRTLDRSRVLGLLEEDEYLKAVNELYDGLDSVELIEISDAILERSGGSFSVALGTFDAIHLSSALAWREQAGISPTFLTHDEILGRAAQALGFQVLGALA